MVDAEEWKSQDLGKQDISMKNVQVKGRYNLITMEIYMNQSSALP